MRGHQLFTSESVSGGHPDKVADQISDAILDAALEAVGGDGAADPGVRTACETLVRRGLVIIAGEIRLPQGVGLDYEALARQAVRDAGYCDGAVASFDADTLDFQNLLDQQSDEIYQGTSGKQEKELGAGDQGMMFGYAVDETPALMPLPIQASHAILRLQSQKRRDGSLPWLRPDAKSQVTVRYEEGQRPEAYQAIFSTLHDTDVDEKTVQEACRALVAEALQTLDLQLPTERIGINTAGPWTDGGPAADCGLTGRKLMVDTYGAMGRHGGGAFSGKDPTKVDRSAAYACRYVAKNIVAAGLARECEVQVSYAIGRAEPGLSVLTFGTGKVDDKRLTEVVAECFDLRPQGIIEALRLWRPLYRKHCVLGHFGGDSAPWEQTDKVEELLAKAG